MTFPPGEVVRPRKNAQHETQQTEKVGPPTVVGSALAGQVIPHLAGLAQLREKAAFKMSPESLLILAGTYSSH